MKQILVLQTPKQDTYTNPAVELKPRRVAEWLEELPLLNPGLSLKQLYDAVTALNQQQVAVKKRLPLLELYRDTALKLFPNCEPDAIERLHVKADAQESILQLMGGFVSSLADGYKILIKEEHKAKQTPDKSALLLLCVYRATEMLALALLHAYRGHHATPPFVFMELHQLYQYAENHQVLDRQIVYEKRAEEGTIEQLYKRIMVIATTDPFHLADGVAYGLFHLLGDYLHLCHISKQAAAAATHKHGLHGIDLDGDSPPQVSQQATVYDDSELMRSLDTSAMLQAIHTRIQSLSSRKTNAEQTTELKLLRQLAPLQQPAPQRQSQRTSTNRSILTGFGIETVHAVLGRNETQLREIAEAGHARIDGSGAVLEEWIIGNESATGFMLYRTSLPEHHARVGDITCILHRKNAHISLAAVRWAKHFDKQRTEIGVEIIPGEAFPVSCQCLESTPADTTDYPGIFLSRVPILNIPATLLLPKKIYSRGKKLKVTTRDRVLHLQAGFLSQDSSSFDRFEFQTFDGE